MKEDTAYQGLLSLDRISQQSKIINWSICFILAIGIIFRINLNYGSGLWDRIPEVRFIAFISPICIIASWLRITGIRWQYILLFIIALPVARFLLIFILFSIVGG
jgi:hypothetical protein